MNNWIKKTLAFAVIILLICISITPLSAFDNIKKSSTPVSDDNTLYVGGNGTGNYTRIQDAIDNASDGDTVIVFMELSPYYENIVINKSITLVGEDKNSVIINGAEIGNVVYSNASYVTICGFTIQYSGNETYNDAGIFIDDTDNNNIIGNIIINNNCGLIIKSSDHNNVVDNIVTMNIGHGAIIDFCKNNSILGNKINSNGYDGICLGSSSMNIVQGNLIENNGYSGIRLVLFSDRNMILGNTVRNSSYRGLFIDGYCDENNIIKNNFIKNKRHVEFYNSIENFWNENYWDNWIGLKIMMFKRFPKLIFGVSMTMVINFDWHPAQEPYDIGM